MHFASNQKLPEDWMQKSFGSNDYVMFGWTWFLLNQSSLCHCVRFTPHRPCIKTTKTRSFLEHQIQVEKINRMGRDFEGDTWNKSFKSLVLISAGFFCKKKRGGKFVKPHKPTMKCFQKLISARWKAWILYRIHLFHISSWWFHQTICRKMKVKLDDFPKLWLVVFKENPLKKPTTFCGKIQVLHL